MTFLPHNIYNYSCIENCLEGSNPPIKDDFPKLDFEKSLRNDTLVQNLLEIAKNEGNEDIPEQNVPVIANGFFSRLKGWILDKILFRIFPRGIFYHPGQLQVLERCSMSRDPFLFLPLKKNHLDAKIVCKVLGKTLKRFDRRTVFAGEKLGTYNQQRSIALYSNESWLSDIQWSIQQNLINTLFTNGCHVLTFLEKDFEDDGKPVLDFSTQVLDHAFEFIYNNGKILLGFFLFHFLISLIGFCSFR